MFSDKRLIRLTQDLIKIDSQNPPGNERKIAFFIKKLLSKNSLQTRLIEFGRDRFNTVTILKGKSSKASLLLTPHLDTVPVGRGWSFSPLGGKIYRDRIYGRGATDCKGNLAVGLEVLRSLSEENIKLNFDLIFAATADEEAGSLYGLLPLLERKIIKPDYALILDANEFDIIIAQKGLLHIKISISGKQAHGAYPDRGINAIDIAMELMDKIKKIKFAYKRHKLLKPPTINIGTIKGGDKVNMVADWCELELDVRFLPGMNKDKIMKTIKNTIRPVTNNFRLKISACQLPCEIDRTHILVRSLEKASRGMANKVRFKGSQGATVMTFFDKYKIPSVATGFGSARCAHTSNEYVKIHNLAKGYHLLRNFLSAFAEELSCLPAV